jgi:hypothetical protein
MVTMTRRRRTRRAAAIRALRSWSATPSSVAGSLSNALAKWCSPPIKRSSASSTTNPAAWSPVSRTSVYENSLLGAREALPAARDSATKAPNPITSATETAATSSEK